MYCLGHGFLYYLYRLNLGPFITVLIAICNKLNVNAQDGFRGAGMFHGASRSQVAENLPPLETPHIAGMIDNGSQLIAKMRFSFWISLSGIYENHYQLEGCITSLLLNLFCDHKACYKLSFM